MPGQLVPRGENTWLVRVPLGRDSKGKRLYHNRTIHGTKKDAERYRIRVLRELDTQTFVEASEKPFGEYLIQWLETSARPRVRSRTLEDYASLSSRYILPVLGNRKLSQIAPADIQGLYASMQGRGLSARTIRYAHSVVHSALEQAVRWRLLARNPAKLVDLPRLERREMRALSREEAARFLEAARADRWHALWVLLLASGLRPAEALALKWADLDGDRIGIQRSLIWGSRDTWELSDPKTARARRVVVLPPSAIRALQAHRARQAEERLQAGTAWQNLGLIFCSRTGAPLEYRVLVRRHFKKLVAEAGLDSLRPYDLRHSCATLLLGAGENVKVVSERLGHASSTLTLDTYSHVLPDMQQQAAERLEALLSAPVIGASRA